jgi:hypothetical protein
VRAKVDISGLLGRVEITVDIIRGERTRCEHFSIAYRRAKERSAIHILLDPHPSHVLFNIYFPSCHAGIVRAFLPFSSKRNPH